MTTSNEARALIEAMRAFINGQSETSWTEAAEIGSLSLRLNNWAATQQYKWRRAHREQIFTKWDLLSEEERAALDTTPFNNPGGDGPGQCSTCLTELATEGDFARHFIVPDPRYYNLGYCPNRKRRSA